MSEQRGDAGAEALAHDADAPHGAPRSGDAPVPHEAAGEPAAHAADGAHATGVDTHDEHGEHADHAEPLGPIDLTAWMAGVVGVALGLAVAVCFVLSVGGIG